MRAFIEFIKEQGVLGLAVGFIMGGAVSKVVSSLVTDVINPLISIALGAAGNFSELSVGVGGAVVTYGKFIASVVDFLVIALVIFYAFKALDLAKLAKRKK